MNRVLKTLVLTTLVLSIRLGFGTALAKKKTTPRSQNQAAAQTAVESIALTLTDSQGNTLAPAGTGEYTVVTRHRYLVTAVIEPATAKASLRWRSSKPSVVSVNSRGVLHCNRTGTAVISASTKNGAVKRTITLTVGANTATFETAADRAVKRIYLKGNSLMMEVVLFNSTSEALSSAPDLAFFLKLSGESDYASLGVKSGKLRKAIPAGETGVAVYRIKRVNAKTILLPGAEAHCRAPEDA